jgi:ParB-like chromosome segregation protein Spo0J
MRHHPYASLFPQLDDAEIQALADDIRTHGQRCPIIVDEAGEILDGRHRSAACVIAGVPPLSEVFRGDDRAKLALVISANLHRRHLTDSQRSAIAAKLATLPVGANQHSGEGPPNDGPSLSVREAADAFKVSPKSVERAKVVQRRGTPVLQAAVESGAIPVSTGAAIAMLPADEQADAIASGKPVPEATERIPIDPTECRKSIVAALERERAKWRPADCFAVLAEARAAVAEVTARIQGFE